MTDPRDVIVEVIEQAHWEDKTTADLAVAGELADRIVAALRDAGFAL